MVKIKQKECECKKCGELLLYTNKDIVIKKLNKQIGDFDYGYYVTRKKDSYDMKTLKFAFLRLKEDIPFLNYEDIIELIKKNNMYIKPFNKKITSTNRFFIFFKKLSQTYKKVYPKLNLDLNIYYNTIKCPNCKNINKTSIDEIELINLNQIKE